MSERFKLNGAGKAVLKTMYAVHGELGNGPVDTRTLELVRLQSSYINGCAFCLKMHADASRKEGLSDDLIIQMGAWHECHLLDDKDRAALTWTEAVLACAHPDDMQDAYDAAGEHWSADEREFLAWAAAEISAWNRIMIASGQVAPK